MQNWTNSRVGDSPQLLRLADLYRPPAPPLQALYECLLSWLLFRTLLILILTSSIRTVCFYNFEIKYCFSAICSWVVHSDLNNALTHSPTRQPHSRAVQWATSWVPQTNEARYPRQRLEPIVGPMARPLLARSLRIGKRLITSCVVVRPEVWLICSATCRSRLVQVASNP